VNSYLSSYMIFIYELTLSVCVWQ